jgi:hypothetical protein
MNTPRRSFRLIAWPTWVALGVLALIFGVGIAGAADSVYALTQFLPVLAPKQGPLVVTAIAFLICVEALLVITGVLVGYIRADRIFRPSALRLVDALVITVAVATLVTIAALFFVPGPPQLYLLVEAAVPLEVTIALVLLVMRSLLRRAVAMRAELDEVV